MIFGTAETDCLRTDFVSWTIGPYHSALPAPMRLHMILDGEVIVQGRIERGYLHRGIEKSLELHSWSSGIVYAGHVDPEAAPFCELVLCLAVEDLAGIVVPLRAQAIRLVLTEMSRICSHLGYMAHFAKIVGAQTVVHYILRDREVILDLFELLTGSRFSFNFLRFGGVSADITEGFIERVYDFCDLLLVRLKEYNDIFCFNQVFLNRSVGVGVVLPETAFRYGLTGPNARASGISIDTRKSHPYCGIQIVDFDVPVLRDGAASFGDSHGRLILRVMEIQQSIIIIKQVLASVPAGDFSSQKNVFDFVLPPGESYCRVESPRGLLGCHVVSDGLNKPCRVQFRVPSLAVFGLIPELIRGLKIEDLPVVLASFDMSISEIDR